MVYKEIYTSIILSRVSNNSNKAKIADSMSLALVLHHVHCTFVASTHHVLSIARMHAVNTFAVSGSDVDTVTSTDSTEWGVDCGVWDSSLTHFVVKIRSDSVST